jgi:hypothetical protein
MEAYKKAVEEVIKNRHIDISIYSCNPYYTAPVAADMKEKHGMKYIIEFRDIWIKDEFITRNWLKRLKKIISRLPFRSYEKRVIQWADAVVTVAPKECEILHNDYPESKSKISVIFNGYDDERLSGDAMFRNEYPKEYIGVFGKFGYYDYEYVVEMLTAIKQLWFDGYKIRILHIGDLDKKTAMALKITKFPQEAYINTGFLDYSQGMALLKGAIACCLIVHYKRALGTKIFDYIYTDKPVVFFAHQDSAIASILSKCKNAFRCESADDASEAIRKIIDENLETLGCSEREVYSRRIQNDRYYKIINEIAAYE